MTETPHPSHTVVVPNSIDMVSVLGPGDEHLGLIERAFKADVHVRGNRITLTGEPAEVALAERLLDEIVTIIRTGQGVTTETVERIISMMRAETTERPADVLSLNILSNRGRTIRPKTLNQKRYVDSIDKHTITFGIGPAGTGKTYLAMAKAVQALQAKEVSRIILTRPAVEAGERLGFLPGTLSEKIDPYLRPLYDALHDMLDPETIPKLLAAGTIEVAPLAYMRGRTLNDAFIILDEAQNTTPEQMKMFLTRLGLRLQDRRHRRRHPGRPARRHAVRPARGRGHPRRGRGRRLQPAHLARRGPAPARGPHRRGVRRLRRHPADRAALARLAPAGDHPMSIEVLNESEQELDVRRLSTLSRFVLDRMRVHPLAELCIKAVDEDTIALLNAQWMDKDGPHRRAGLPDGRAAARQGQRGARGGRARRPRAVPERGRAPGRGGRSRHRRRDRAAHRARHPAPARLRPRRAARSTRRCSACRRELLEEWRASAPDSGQ